MYAIRSYYDSEDVIKIHTNFWNTYPSSEWFSCVINHPDLHGIAINIFETCFYNRITSYNVCYTKLLRQKEASNYILKVLESDDKFVVDSLMFWRNQNISAFSVTVDRNRNTWDNLKTSGHRITSYNVCYTKLLRANYYSGSRH